ncbi:TIGR03086 family metal-binding protein [Mycobacterium sp.]|uniref:TIGR03086 family metal-binding protein n=1 Tax=Mycobacterium sp. TaxID=1785 RepID=UPI003F9C651B
MPPDLRPGPDSPPPDELASAEDTLGVLQQVLHTVAGDDMSRQTPCTQFNVAQLTEHLLNSITAIGGMAGAEMPATDEIDSAERRVVSAARPALDAWHRRGLEGSVPFGKGEMLAKGACGILSVEFLVHAWDYARAVGHDVNAPEPLAEYVLGLARATIQPELRSRAGFDDPVAVAEDAGALDRLVAFTGRNPRPA